MKGCQQRGGALAPHTHTGLTLQPRCSAQHPPWTSGGRRPPCRHKTSTATR